MGERMKSWKLSQLSGETWSLTPLEPGAHLCWGPTFLVVDKPGREIAKETLPKPHGEASSQPRTSRRHLSLLVGDT